MKACSFFWILKRLVNVKNVKQINIDAGNTDEEIRHRVHFKRMPQIEKAIKRKQAVACFYVGKRKILRNLLTNKLKFYIIIT